MMSIHNRCSGGSANPQCSSNRWPCRRHASAAATRHQPSALPTALSRRTPTLLSAPSPLSHAGHGTCCSLTPDCICSRPAQPGMHPLVHPSCRFCDRSWASRLGQLQKLPVIQDRQPHCQTSAVCGQMSALCDRVPMSNGTNLFTTRHVAKAHLWVEMEPMVELMLMTLRVSFFSKSGSNACVTLRDPTTLTSRILRYSAGSLQADVS